MTFVRVGNTKIKVNKIAIKESDFTNGLMYRMKPAVMVFPFPKIEKRSFWMRNTIIPLDILFCCAGKVISIENGIPYSLKHIGNVESDLVIEMPFGMAKKLNIKSGDNVQLENSLSVIAARFAQLLKL